jgi:hypothetical protein
MAWLLLLGLRARAEPTTEVQLFQEDRLEESNSEGRALTLLSGQHQLTPFSFLDEELSPHAWIRGGDHKDSCYDITDCNECTFTSHCHWCQHDQRCHVIGSPYGCVTATGCGEPEPKPTPPDSCAQYPNCVACGNTHTCHWCAHDESCHTIGSIYGCIRGVECYADDRCRRKKAEPLPPPQQTFTNMGLFPMILVTVGSLVMFCGASICFCCFCGVKGAYQDLLLFGRGGTSRRQTRSQENHTTDDVQEEENTNESTSPVAVFIESDRERVEQEPDPANAAETGKIDPEPFPEETKTDGGDNATDQFHPALEMEIEVEYRERSQRQGEQIPLLPRQPQSTDETEIITEEPQSLHMGRMHRMCSCLYFLFVIALGGLTFVTIRFYPKIPEYSVCNDSVAWTRLFESLATLKTEVDFEILMSFENANHLGVSLDQGHGIFKYSGEQIGHYRIPPVDAPAMSIIDVLIIATLTPTTWEAMEISKDYYEGTLVLGIDVDLEVRTPWLFNMSTPVSVRDRPVEINRNQERHLCACKTWDGNGTRTEGAHHHGLLDWFPFLSGSGA